MDFARSGESVTPPVPLIGTPAQPDHQTDHDDEHLDHDDHHLDHDYHHLDHDDHQPAQPEHDNDNTVMEQGNRVLAIVLSVFLKPFCHQLINLFVCICVFLKF